MSIFGIFGGNIRVSTINVSGSQKKKKKLLNSILGPKTTKKKKKKKLARISLEPMETPAQISHSPYPECRNVEGSARLIGAKKLRLMSCDQFIVYKLTSRRL